ncbi:unnamed protein product, partial [Mesorhabditis spiculigera]
MMRIVTRPADTTMPTIAANSTERCAQRVKQIWKQADCVCFDVDSTVCRDEAIDELARYLGVGDAVAQVTRQAMNGNARFRDALSARLDVMRPSRDQVEGFKKENPPKMTPGIVELVKALHARSVSVYLVSGGFRSLIEPVAAILGIPKINIYANQLLYNADGSYAGFDENELTSDSGSKEVGKPGVCGLLKSQHGYRNLVMIGDGATDLEAAPPANAFIGFGGNQVRESVRSQADWFVNDFDVLRKELDAQ